MSGGGDLIFFISPNIGIGIGAGYVQASSSSVVDLSRPGASAVISVDPKASAVPLRAGLYISLPMGASAGLVLHGGAGYYLGTFESLLRIEEGSDDIQWEQKAAGQGIGFHGGIGLEMNFGPHFGLILEGLGCLAKISGFDGDVTLSMSGFSDTESGKLYFYRVADAVLGTFPLTVINDSPPSGIGVSNVHEAAVDFSGFTVRAGLIFKF